MLSNLNKGLALALAVAVLGGCATSKEKLLPHGDSTMMDIWQQNAGDGSGGAGQVARRQLLDARQRLPHLAGTDPVPVPGYTTVFPLYQRVQYAMPGERVEDY